MGLHFLSFWPFGPCGPSFPCILALWASFPCIFAFSGSASGPPPTSCQKWPDCPTSLQRIYQRQDRLHFAVFSLLGLYFLAFWPCRPSFPCILALWAFISLQFGLVGLHFLAFWPFRGRILGPPPQVAKNGPFAQRPYNGFISAVTGSILQFLAFWAFISLHFGLVGLHFLAFWLCGPSFPCILALWAFISLHFGLVGLHFLAFWPFRGRPLGPPPQVAKNGPFAQRPYNEWIYQGRDRLHFAVFSLLGLHFLAFWPCGPSFPCILAFWVFISLCFGLLGFHFLSFWPCGPSFPCILAFSGSASGPPPQVAKNCPFAQRPYNGFSSAVTGPILQFFSLLGLHFLAFWPCGPSFPCILALWALISLHFGLVSFHFLAFWPCGPSFPCILALWAFASFHFGFFGVSFWGPPH